MRVFNVSMSGAYGASGHAIVAAEGHWEALQLVRKLPAVGGIGAGSDSEVTELQGVQADANQAALALPVPYILFTDYNLV